MVVAVAAVVRKLILIHENHRLSSCEGGALQLIVAIFIRAHAHTRLIELHKLAINLVYFLSLAKRCNYFSRLRVDSSTTGAVSHPRLQFELIVSCSDADLAFQKGVARVTDRRICFN